MIRMIYIFEKIMYNCITNEGNACAGGTATLEKLAQIAHLLCSHRQRRAAAVVAR